MRILILGGDGYLGWPTSMYLAGQGHQVMVVDNYLRRQICLEQGLTPLIAVPDLHQRCQQWLKSHGSRIEFAVGDVTDYPFLLGIFQRFEPEVVIHYAEQPSAPYSMMGYREARLTVSNNLISTLNVAYAVRETNPACHIIKLGTMGEYGTPNIDIEEGFIDLEHKGRSDRLLFPRQAGSLYHTTKIQDTDLLYFYVRVWGLRVTDLMQGPVYGLMTPEMGDDPKLFTFFNYDEQFGTVLNRFMVQAVAGIPLTVYGKGGQTRGYLNLMDVLQCVRLAVEKGAAPGEMQIFNQFTETFSVNQLAEKVQRVGGAMGLDVQIKSLPNPRKELEEHYYNPVHKALTDLGLTPNLLTDEVIAGMLTQAQRYRDAIQPAFIQPKTQWK
ncbi:MAG: NAD-dependent epimerase/dehydratase family protein [Magnetococcales bacterium]|nr:NAD-dependent epimerase/dehydratase family protein [Magnetococcales bacterium]